MTLYISAGYILIILFVYAYSNVTNAFHEGRLDSPLLFYIVKKLRKQGQTHVISRNIFAVHLDTVAPLKPG
jgi:hypothetical protein